jgi:glyoxylase-like metal-dependent hydrolase (beta-lactamase superfamily II)
LPVIRVVAGDMLSDALVPMLDLSGTADPVGDYLAALRLLEGVAGDVDVLVPGHGSIGGAGQVRARIDQDRAYVQALDDAVAPGDPRVGPSATFDWMPGVHERQLQQLAREGQWDACRSAPQESVAYARAAAVSTAASSLLSGHPSDPNATTLPHRLPAVILLLEKCNVAGG